MILPFSLQLNGEHTLFVEKITMGLLKYEPTRQLMEDYKWPINLNYVHPFSCRGDLIPKIHTMREDKKQRWKKGNKIHYVVNNRTKKQWQFAPVVPCVDTQRVIILWKGTTVKIFIDGVIYITFNSAGSYTLQKDASKLQRLAFNDGFETIDAFLKYFHYDWKGKIIHWTNFKY